MLSRASQQEFSSSHCESSHQIHHPLAILSTLQSSIPQSLRSLATTVLAKFDEQTKYYQIRNVSDLLQDLAISLLRKQSPTIATILKVLKYAQIHQVLDQKFELVQVGLCLSLQNFQILILTNSFLIGSPILVYPQLFQTVHLSKGLSALENHSARPGME